MCCEVLVRKDGKELLCETVGQLADALGKRPIEVHSYSEDRDCCLCGFRQDDLGAREATREEGWPWPEYVIEYAAASRIQRDPVEQEGK